MRETIMCSMKKVILSFSLLVGVNGSMSYAKDLKCPQIDILNLAFQGFPFALARMKLSNRAAHKTDKLLNHHDDVTKTDNKNIDDATLIKEQLHTIFEPIKDFFAEIRQCSFLIKPLIEKSLPEKILKKSYIMKFMHSSSAVLEFFEHEITTKEKLNDVCQEIKTFLTDVEDNVSEETQKIYHEFVQEVKRAKQTGAVIQKTPLKLFNLDTFEQDTMKTQAAE